MSYSEQLEALPYLDAVRSHFFTVLYSRRVLSSFGFLFFPSQVILESIRVYPSVPNTQRVAVHDDIIPLSMPVKGRDGKEITELRIKAGTPLWLRE